MSDDLSKYDGWENRLPAIFAECADPAGATTKLPWVQDGWVYATNGRICVRTQHRPEFDPLPGPGLLCPPDGASLPWAGPFSDPLATPPAYEAPALVPCPACGGRGQVACNMGHDHDCLGCDASGEVRERVIIAWSNTALDAKYYSLVAEAGGKLYAPEPLNRHRPCRFEISGPDDSMIEGLIAQWGEADIEQIRAIIRQQGTDTWTRIIDVPAADGSA